MFIALLVLKFKRIAFLAMVKAMSIGFEFWDGGFITERSPGRDLGGGDGTLQPIMRDVLLMTSFQKKDIELVSRARLSRDYYRACLICRLSVCPTL